MASRCASRYVRDAGELAQSWQRAKLSPCPHCHRTGAVVGHGVLRGYADQRGSSRVRRGRRLLCSNRFRRPGCGRTFSVLLASVLAGFVVRTQSLSRLLLGVCGGLSVKRAWEQASDGAMSLQQGSIGPGVTLARVSRDWLQSRGVQSGAGQEGTSLVSERRLEVEAVAESDGRRDLARCCWATGAPVRVGV